MLIDTRKEDKSSENGLDPNVQNAIVPASYTGFEMFLFVFFSVITIGIFFLVVFIGKKNWFNKMQIRINAAASNIEVQIKYRRDTLIKLVDATKSSVDYEKNLLTSLTQLRSKSFDFKDEAGRENIAALDKVGSKINAVMENYPKLQSVETIQQLMTTADYSEREIAASRRLYNANVQEFNSALYRFPTKIIAKIHNLYNFPLFSVNKQDMQDVSLNIA